MSEAEFNARLRDGTIKVKGEKPVERKPRVKREYKSKTEATFARDPYIVMADFIPKGERIVNVTYEVPLVVEGGVYTIDWRLKLSDGEYIFVETKNAKNPPSKALSRAKLRAAAERYFCFRFFQATLAKTEWHVEPIILRRNRPLYSHRRARQDLLDWARGGHFAGDDYIQPFFALVDLIELLEAKLAGD